MARSQSPTPPANGGPGAVAVLQGMAGRSEWHIAIAATSAVTETPEAWFSLALALLEAHTDEWKSTCLTGVGTDPTRRRRGYAAAAVGAALELADEEIAKGSAEFMLFQTGDASPLYDKLGCARFPKDAIAGQRKASKFAAPEGAADWDLHPHCLFDDYHVVVYPGTAVEELSGSTIDIHGPGW